MIANFISDFWYETSRDLIASVTNRFGNRAISSFIYGNDSAGRRISISKGGEAMGSLAGSVDSYGYNARNEVVSAHRTLDGSAVPGFSEGFAYDPIGNRITATEHDETGASYVSGYAANELNQYVSRSVPGLVSARGFADSGAFVTVNGNEAFRMGEYYFGSDLFDNSVQSGFAGVETYAALNCETNDLVSAVTNVAFLASATESFIYDEDGNLVEDARFRYFWNGENRMVRAEEKLAPPGREPYIVACAYDHMGRNVIKDGAMFIWDGYNITVENAGASNETHNVWGLDLDGTMQGAGGVGGLLAVERNGSVAFPAYDANGNITEYVIGSGEILSHCDYSAFGRELIKTGSDDFIHRFSTKPYCRKTGMLEYQLRKYRPWCGRWINRDAIEEEGGLDLYGFVWNASIYKFDNKGNLPLNLILIVQLRNCLGTIMAWKPGGKNDSDANDKNKHCRASCDIANDCGAAASALLGLGKEIGDNFGLAIESIVNMIPNELMSEDSKNWVRNNFMSSSIGDSIGDLIADANGIACAISGKSCDECCENECPK